MTIGWAAACVDGVVLMADSMHVGFARSPEGTLTDVWPETMPEKLLWIDDRLAAVAAGWFEGLPPHGLRYDGGPLASVAQELVDFLAEHVAPVPQVNELHGAHLLVGGRSNGGSPELHLLQSAADGPDRGAGWRGRIPAGSAAGVGMLAWRRNAEGASVMQLGPEHLDDALTVDAALGIGVATCRRYIRDHYRRHGGVRLGDFPGSLVSITGERIVPIAFPLQVGVITAEETVRYEVFLTGDVTEDDVARAKALQARSMAAAAGVSAPAAE